MATSVKISVENLPHGKGVKVIGSGGGSNAIDPQVIGQGTYSYNLENGASITISEEDVSQDADQRPQSQQ